MHVRPALWQCTQVLSGLFTYVCTIALPWRLANLFHLLATRDIEPRDGIDFYCEKSEDIWFNLPWGSRARIILLMMLNVLFQYIHQFFHLIYHTYEDSIKDPPGSLLLPATMILSAGCGCASGIVQWKAETSLRAREPTRFPPSPFELMTELHRRWKKGERARSLLRLAMKPESHGASLLATTKRRAASMHSVRINGGVSPPGAHVTIDLTALQGDAKVWRA